MHHLKKPYCAYTQAEIRDSRDPELHVVIYVEEGEPGYYETTYTGSLDYVEKVAVEINKTLGHTEDRVREIVASSMRRTNSFNRHANVTADGVVIVEGLRVITNEMRHGTVVKDRNESMCCERSHDKAQLQQRGTWFTDHDKGRDCVGRCTACRHNHWFDVEYDDGGGGMFDGERMATAFEGVSA